jgi:hypothetical protein
MKKLYFTLLGITLSLSFAFSQAPTFELVTTTASTTPITNNAIFDKATSLTADVSYYFILKNITATTQTYTIRKYDNLLNTVSVGDEAAAYFCTGTTCYVPTVYSALFVIPANSSDDFIVYLDEASALGLSNIGYEVQNGTEKLAITMRYNFATGIATNLNDLSSASNIYPNPSSSKSFIDVNALKELSGTSLKVYNCLGALVSSKEISLQKGKNKISIDNESLETGVYFVKIINGSSTLTRKLTVTK